jgi:hypothetical protein
MFPIVQASKKQAYSITFLVFYTCPCNGTWQSTKMKQLVAMCQSWTGLIKVNSFQ